jgi:microcystin-dependent protein
MFVVPATTISIGGIIVGQGLNVTGSGVLAVNPVPPGFIPAGTVQWFAGSVPPTGWLYCDGTVLEIGSNPDLYAVIGRSYTGISIPPTQFQIPDLRGLFIRGWENRAGGGRDNGRIFGSVQGDTFRSHTHSLQLNTAGYRTTQFNNQIECLAPATNQQNSDSRQNSGTITVETGDGGGVPIQNTGDAETRPVNIALLPIIKL